MLLPRQPGDPQHPSLRHLTIKPHHGCRYNCPYCKSRRDLFRKSGGIRLGLDDWAGVFADADRLGCQYLDISGGEPTLYRLLPGLVWEAKRRGWFVSLNSSGYGIPAALDALAAACLDQVIISLLSIDAARHDSARGAQGSWQTALRAMDRVASSGMRLIIHLIVNRHNYAELPLLIDFAFARGAAGLALVYPEDDGESRHLLMTAAEILRFRAEVLPECLRRYASHRPIPDASHANLAGLFAMHGVSGDFSAGRYWTDIEDAHRCCLKPESFALIYANGDVLPCNGVEYSHRPIAGNVLRQSLGEIWTGPEYAAFRESRMAFCRLCPSSHHTGIAVHRADNPPYAAPVVRRIPEALPVARPAAQDRGGSQSSGRATAARSAAAQMRALNS